MGEFIQYIDADAQKRFSSGWTDEMKKATTKRPKYSTWVARFEFATLDTEGKYVDVNTDERSKVIAWELAEVDRKKKDDSAKMRGTTISGFVEQMSKLGDSVVLFHNLRFFYTFIQRELFTRGFDYLTKREIDEREAERAEHPNGLSIWQDMRYKFNELITGSSLSLNMVNIVFDRTHVKLQDSNKLYPYPLEEIADAFNAPFKKHDYSQFKYNSRKMYKMKSNDWEHLDICINVQRDLMIYHITQHRKNYIDVSRSSLAFSELQRIYNKEHGFVRGKHNKDDITPFELDFPSTPVENGIFKKFYQAYFGGMVLINPIHTGKVINEPVFVHDVNSEFPYQMASKPLPLCRVKERTTFKRVGDKVIPMKTQAQFSSYYIDKPLTNKLIKKYIKNDNLSILKISFTGFNIRIKSNGLTAIPTYPKNRGRYTTAKNIYSDLDLIETDKTKIGNTFFEMFTNIDLQMILDSYSFDNFKIIEVHTFESVVGPFAGFVNKFMEDKEKGRQMVQSEKQNAMAYGRKENRKKLAYGNFLAMNSKLTVNSSYGSFARNPYNTEIVPVKEDKEDGSFILGYEDGERGLLDTNCLFMAIFIAAWARFMLWKGVRQIGWKHVAYSDTDSIHSFKEDTRLDIHPTRLGAWSVDVYHGAYFYRPKVYAEGLTNKAYKQRKASQKTGETALAIDFSLAGFKTTEVDGMFDTLDDFAFACQNKIELPTLTNVMTNGQSLIVRTFKKIDAN